MTENLLHMCDPFPDKYITHEVGILTTVFLTMDTHIIFKGKQDLFICQPFKYL